jgi:predicted transcriptional regulator
MPKTGRPTGAAPKTLTAFRLPPDLLKRVDVYAERLQRETPWSTVTRADAVRALPTRALEAVEPGAKGNPRKGR